MNHDVVKIKFGSHLYGTTTPSSDMDFKSVFIPTREEILHALTAPQRSAMV